jgi:glycyl-tRNA synthetase alpha chain
MYFEDIISTLQEFWKSHGCNIIPGCDVKVGAATSCHFTLLRCIENKPWNICQTQFCRRPADARFAQNPNRLGSYYQMQVIMRPIPENIQTLCIDSFASIGIDKKLHDFRFIEDNWENPSLGATGLGFEVWCDNMEILQYTYMQQIGGIKCQSIPVELTYGLERVAMYVQNVDNIFDIQWNKDLKYSDIHYKDTEIDFSRYYSEYKDDTEKLRSDFEYYLKNSELLIKNGILIPAYEECLNANHVFNVLDSRGVLSNNDRTAKILQIRGYVKMICEAWSLKYNN